MQCVPSAEGWTADEECGVFVSAGRGTTEGSGTKDAPLSSLQDAIATAQQNGTGRVYACAGEGEGFNGAVEVPGGITLYGGLDCANGWTWVGQTQKTTLTAESGTIPLTMRGLPGAVHIEDVHVMAQPGMLRPQNQGVSSIAAIAMSTSVELVRCVLEARDAASGPGGTSYPNPAADGAPGLPGGDACSNDGDRVAGGSAVINNCGTPADLNDDSIGGEGGEGRMTQGYNGESGRPLALGDSGNGGVGRVSGSDMPCTAGGAGSNGGTGTPGADATGIGVISMTGYTGASGRPAGHGAPGQGGGGGGGERGASATNRSCPGGVRSRAGAAGGSGGAGGCGGLGGLGGYWGGASIALISIEAALSFEDVLLQAGNGGNGGDGRYGQIGGMGGAGGTGGVVPPNSSGISPACQGGRGGNGGNGGKGGGGQGGHSLGIAVLGAPPQLEGVTISLGTAGRGGEGIDPDHRGADGLAMDMLDFDN
ncbi:PGRS family protein [Sorangium sp. So ce1335]|uniref:PGRS family protein n=1 Tax=Sorangium sp. So ce1335 TaxID=3133335 RepID=UPI003F62D0F6